MKTYTPFPKLARLNREVVMTEKLDGTNASITIVGPEYLDACPEYSDTPGFDVGGFKILVGSRTRWITPSDDNFGFATWAYNNKEELLGLGIGQHFGEWWGHGIQRNYGLKERRFSLFNTKRWRDEELPPLCCSVVPVIYQGPMHLLGQMLDGAMIDMRTLGSIAAPGFMKPEGVVIWHTAAQVSFKVTCENDSVPKSKVKVTSE